MQWPSLQGMPMVTRLDESKDRAFASIQAVFASLQKADMKAKLGAGRRERAAQGLPYGGQVPYGYDRVPKGPFVVNEAQAADLRSDDGLGDRRARSEGRSQPGLLARALPVRGAWPTGSHPPSQESSRAKRSWAWSESGEWCEKWVPARDQRPIITRERWEQAQAVLGSRKRYSDHQRRHALAGLLKCSACGYTLRYMVQRRQ